MGPNIPGGEEDEGMGLGSVRIADSQSVWNLRMEGQVRGLPPREAQLHKYKVCPLDATTHYAPEVEYEHMSNMELAKSKLIFTQEFGELSFNQRVLAAALDQDTPLLERFKFCCIVSSNLDEHFAKRLGNIPKVQADEDDAPDTSKMKASIRPRTEFEEKFSEAVTSIVNIQYKCLMRDILPKLQEHGVKILRYRDLDDTQKADMDEYFRKKLYPMITPLSVDQTHPFPMIQSHGIYLVIVVLNPETSRTRRLYFRIPNVKPRVLPVGSDRLCYLPIEEICIANVDKICEGMELLKAYPFRVTRNVKLVIDDTLFGESDNLLDFVWEEVHRRRSAPATRLEITKQMPADIRSLLVRELYLDDTDVYTIPNNLLGLADFFPVSFSPVAELQYPPHVPMVPKRLVGLEERLHEDPGKIFSVIRKEDLLVDYPTMSFNESSLLFLRAAARCPKVRMIKCVLYRGGSDSPLVASLIRAAKNGKEVSVLVELKASFDEVQNSTYAKQLMDAGCNVSYGLVGLKTHSKIMLIVRQEENGFRQYCQIATGNFNPSTAKIYTDLALFTCREDICADVLDLFNALTGFSRKRQYRRLLVAPVNMLDSFIELIDNEAENARKGLPARIILQINGLTETECVSHLYAASQAGVQIDLICRGLCAIRPGLPGKSDNIRVFSWIGRFLQHRRIFYFLNGGREKYFIGSADWRNRNLTARVEVITPIDDAKIQRKLMKMMTFFLEDELNTWEMASDGKYYLRKPETIDRESEASLIGKAGTLTAQVLMIDKDEQIAKSEDVANPVRNTGWTKEWTVQIKGVDIFVSDIAYGCVPIRFVDEHKVDPELLLVSSSKGSEDWSFMSADGKESETPVDVSKRCAAQRGGVKGGIIGNLGWFLRGKDSKKAVQLFVMDAESELDIEWPEQYVRDRKWIHLSDAQVMDELSSDPLVESVLSALDDWVKSHANATSQNGAVPVPLMEEAAPPVEEPIAPMEEPIAPTEEPIAPMEEPVAEE
ncbi:Polyphosphate kinase [Porphyridium purpureum]|uniref:ATP-polyphosphate phosphotransferase n=1 Tax=Porphyridium purpureum TaxID=35688 RepID=A0A5J4Z1Z9_PORPP|nr:Polyphosphate kinase [Porphyridium purpureum]|eukprot:POR6884..scf208_2